MAEEYKTNESLESSLIGLIKERIKSPYLWLLLGSWLVWNWRAVLYIFDLSQPLEERFKIIDQRYVSLENNLIFPFLSSIGIYLVVPYLLWFVEWASSYGKRIRKEAANKTHLDDINNELEIINAKYNLLKANERHKTLEQRLDKISELERIMESQEEEIRLLKSKYDNAKNGLAKAEENSYLHLILGRCKVLMQNDTEEEINKKLKEFETNIMVQDYRDSLDQIYEVFSERIPKLSSKVMSFVTKHDLIVNPESDKFENFILNKKGLFIIYSYFEFLGMEYRKKIQLLNKKKSEELRNLRKKRRE
jgi:hypothetical protein